MYAKVLGGTLAVTVIGGWAIASVGVAPALEAFGPKWGPKCDEIMASSAKGGLHVKSDKRGQVAGLQYVNAEEWRALALEEAGCDIGQAPDQLVSAPSASGQESWEDAEKRWRVEERREIMEGLVSEKEGGWGD